MPQIRPVSDLRNNFAAIAKIAHETAEPIFLTKNGHGDMVVMSIDAYENFKEGANIILKLKEAELEAKSTNVRYSHEEVFNDLRGIIVAEDPNLE